MQGVYIVEKHYPDLHPGEWEPWFERKYFAEVEEALADYRKVIPAGMFEYRITYRVYVDQSTI